MGGFFFLHPVTPLQSSSRLVLFTESRSRAHHPSASYQILHEVKREIRFIARKGKKGKKPFPLAKDQELKYERFDGSKGAA